MENYRIVSLEHTDVHESLLKWASWARVRHHPATCGSLERNYKPPPMYHPNEPHIIPDLKLVYAIEHLIVSAPKGYGRHVIYFYLKKLNPQATAKKLRVSKDRLVPHLNETREWMMRHLK